MAIPVDLEEDPQRHSVASEISGLVVRVTREHTGRGPERAHTHLAPDLVTVVLSELMTKGEQKLVACGRTDEVLRMRRAFQEVMRDDLVAGIEQITGREVVAFLSANHGEPDIAIESFVLAPPT